MVERLVFALLASHLCHHEAWCWAWPGNYSQGEQVVRDCSTSCLEGFLIGRLWLFFLVSCLCLLVFLWFHPVLLCNRQNASGSATMVKLVQSSLNLRTRSVVWVFSEARFPLVNWTRRLDAYECGSPAIAFGFFLRMLLLLITPAVAPEMSSLRIWDLAQSTGVRNGVLITGAHFVCGSVGVSFWCVKTSVAVSRAEVG